MLESRCYIFKFYIWGDINMTSYELLDFYEKVLNKMKELDEYTSELSKLIIDLNQHKDQMLNTIYGDGVNSNSNVLQSNINERNAVINSMQRFALNFDVLKNEKKLIRVKDKIEDILNSSSISLEEEKNKIINLLDEYDKVTSIIYEYVRTRNNSIIVELLNKVTSIVNAYDKFIQSYKNIKEFMLKTENKAEVKETEKLLILHFYDEHIEIEDYISNFKSINESYGIMCEIFHISSNDYKLRVLKIESGSLFEKFLGAEAAIEALSFLIKKITEWVFSKFTFEGQVLRHKQILDLITQDLEIRAKYKELGFEIGLDNEEIVKRHYQVVKSIAKLIGRTTKVKIDDKEFSLEDHLKQKYLEESKTLFLKESNIEMTLDEVSKEDLEKSTDKNEK